MAVVLSARGAIGRNVPEATGAIGPEATGRSGRVAIGPSGPGGTAPKAPDLTVPELMGLEGLARTGPGPMVPGELDPTEQDVLNELAVPRGLGVNGLIVTVLTAGGLLVTPPARQPRRCPGRGVA